LESKPWRREKKEAVHIVLITFKGTELMENLTKEEGKKRKTEAREEEEQNKSHKKNSHPKGE